MFRRIISALVIAGILTASFIIETKLNTYRIEKTNRQKLSSEVKIATESGRKIDWDALHERNKDVIGWIHLPDSEIDYPVLQGEDNEYYLHRDINRNFLYDGCIYVDAACKEPFKEPNTVVFGHKMLSGAMFAGLKYYSDKEYWADHATIYLYTPEADYELKPVAYTRDTEYSELYRHIDEEVNEDYLDLEDLYFTKENFLDLVKEKSVITEGSLDPNAIYVTLSTCVYADSIERQQLVCIREKVEKDAPVLINEDSYPDWLNKFFISQIAVGFITVIIILAMTMPRKEKKR